MNQRVMIKLLSVLFLFFSQFTTIAQTIKGKISDTNGEPIAFANLVEKGTNNGGISDVNGLFTIEVTKLPTTLEGSFIGYLTTTKDITNQNFVNIVLKEDNVSLEEVVLLGSRSKSRTVINTPVPVDVIDVSKIATQGAQLTVNQILNYVAPSFSSTPQTVSDGTDHIDPATLRGLGPDQVLVLINGKRRHKTSLVNVNGTVGTGTVGTDLNAIPTAAIEKIEVLRDGAAAQYGSDAIAGVINIVLKKGTNELLVNVNSGANFSKHSEKYNESGVDGENFQIDANYGVSLGTKGGYINFTGSLENRDATNRSDEMGQPIYTEFDIASRALGYDNAYALTQDELTQYITDNHAGISNYATLSDYELDQRGLTRDDFRMKIGQSKLRSGKFIMNMEVPLNTNGSVFYSFGGISYRDGLAAGFYRRPAYSDNRSNTETFANGFLPHIASTVGDQSISAGVKGKLGDWDVDFSNTFGRNSFDFTIKNTTNATLGTSSPTEFEAGGFAFSQNTTNLDLTKEYDDIFEGLNVALGTEYRVENYQLTAGEEASWASYDVNGQIVTGNTPDSLKQYSYYGGLTPGGAQVFPGYRPTNEVDQNRNSYAAYLDLEADITALFLLSGAIRYENYSDFGSTFNWKLASRYKLSEHMAVRGAVSTGFRAPDLHQIHFNATATQFIGGVANEVGTFSNNSQLAGLLGIPKLEEETSENFSLGFTARIPETRLKITLDGYIVNVDNRVGLTKNYEAPGNGSEIDDFFQAAAAGKAKFFTNGYDTESKGVDIVVSHKYDLNSDMELTNSLAASLSETKVTNVKRIIGDPILDARAISFIEDAMTRTKFNLTHNLEMNQWNFMLRNVYFGEVSDPDFKGTDNEVTYGGKVITDISASYKMEDHGLTITVGSNNLLDIYPDEVPESGNYGGQFRFSRRISQFGFNGRYLFVRLTLKLK